ncbi:URC4/urg3 family protein [Mycolicibacterium sp. F2034L]|uniref:URC4/urg3 family protein n=1 Tax=Mycolicibacterium sp. F2034L TaxID=2926422 RepID=UPI001FF58CBB|nr:URC4/urg3 family protein [Mycolicibacterium sp. F2034L]MCK0176094.1 URC4/urg3 family protein [Mycolicibacterium sp. F2034L]
MNPAVAELRTTAAVRERSGRLLARARAGDSAWFIVDDAALEPAAAEVAGVTRRNHPDLKIPFHSRWRHFEAGGVRRTADLDTRAMIDLTVVSVLLDAGAGPDWRYTEAATGQTFSRSEGLGVASWHSFLDGTFSADPDNPLRADTTALTAMDTERLAAAFQVHPGNPLTGLDGRVALLRRLGAALEGAGRPAALFDALGDPVDAHDILDVLLRSVSPIWLTGNEIDGEPLGDCWRHRALSGPGDADGWIPFHKLSQWLTYSLLEPITWAGVEVRGLDALTGLPEYRNGGLLLDTGVLRLRDPDLVAGTWSVGDELVVEWRALTVALLDELAPMVCADLGVDLPLACVLEGGTWAAGRVLAQRMRGGAPPLTIASDGTVF